MKIVNVTRKKAVAERVEMAQGFWKKMIGLMFRKGLGEKSCFLMEFPDEGFHGIWMPFMRFPIDIIFLDSEKRVVGVSADARPLGLSPSTWRVYYPEKPAKWVLELVAGKAGDTGTRMRDVFSW